MEYIVQVETKSDTIFGNGQSVPGYIDSDILHDGDGFPYMNGKTFKGKLGEAANMFIAFFEKEQPKLHKTLLQEKEQLFGREGVVNEESLKFSDCQLSLNLRNYVKTHMTEDPKSIKSQDVLESLTYIQRQTSIDYKTGVAKEGSLRNFRVIIRGLVFEVQVHAPKALNEQQQLILAGACKLLQHLGGQETKGKGQVETSLWLDGLDVMDDYLDLIDKVVS